MHPGARSAIERAFCRVSGLPLNERSTQRDGALFLRRARVSEFATQRTGNGTPGFGYRAEHKGVAITVYATGSFADSLSEIESRPQMNFSWLVL